MILHATDELQYISFDSNTGLSFLNIPEYLTLCLISILVVICTYNFWIRPNHIWKFLIPIFAISCLVYVSAIQAISTLAPNKDVPKITSIQKEVLSRSPKANTTQKVLFIDGYNGDNPFVYTHDEDKHKFNYAYILGEPKTMYKISGETVEKLNEDYYIPIEPTIDGIEQIKMPNHPIVFGITLAISLLSLITSVCFTILGSKKYTKNRKTLE